MKPIIRNSFSSLFLLSGALGASLLGACSMLDFADAPVNNTISCETATDCPGEESSCRYRVCDDNVCGMAQVKSGYAPPSQLSGDCLQLVCNQDAELVEVADESDVYDDGLACTQDKCDGGPINEPLASGTTCSDTSGTVCDGEGACVVCVSNDDCEGTAVCQSNSCVAASCTNSDLDGDESDIDCGGTECNPCDDGQQCGEGNDCASAICTNNRCAAPTCNDGVSNGAETDQDCGGATSCNRCSPGLQCLAMDGSDCDSDVCVGGACQEPSCSDQVENGTESDVDCGGNTGCTPCIVGDKCNTTTDCKTGLTCQLGTCNGNVPIGNGGGTGSNLGAT